MEQRLFRHSFLDLHFRTRRPFYSYTKLTQEDSQRLPVLNRRYKRRILIRNITIFYLQSAEVPLERRLFCHFMLIQHDFVLYITQVGLMYRNSKCYANAE